MIIPHENIDIKVGWRDLKQFPNHRILVIGNPNQPVINYIDILLRMKYNIIWVGENVQGEGGISVNIGKYEFKVSHYPEFIGIPMHQFDFSLKGLLDFIGMDFSLILHFQNWWMPTDKQKSPIPYIYIPSETWSPQVPFCAHGTTYSGKVMKDIIEKYHPNIPIIGYLPYPLNKWMEDIPYTKDYVNHSGFCGHLGTLYELYEERRQTLFALRDLLGDKFVGHWKKSPQGFPVKYEQNGKGTLEAEDYRNFCQNTLFGVNVPTVLGSQFRDIEIPSAGRCLLTKKTSDLENMGFKEGIHYLAYNDVKELVSLINNVDPKKALKIGQNGQKLVQHGHYILHRLPFFEMLFEKFGLVAHAKEIGFWKIISKDKDGGITFQIRTDDKDPNKFDEVYIGKDSYYPIGIKYDDP